MVCAQKDEVITDSLPLEIKATGTKQVHSGPMTLNVWKSFWMKRLGFEACEHEHMSERAFYAHLSWSVKVTPDDIPLSLRQHFVEKDRHAGKKRSVE